VATWLCLLTLEVAFAQAIQIRNPRTSSEDVAAGGRIYRSHCAECHGLNGQGGRGPDLTLGIFRRGSDDANLHSTILDGIPGTEMPGVYMEDQQVWQIVSYVRSLSARPAKRDLPGDRNAGMEIFRGKGGCLQCHLVNGEGGRFGPDLSDVGGTRTPAFLKTALLEPGKEVPQAWWTYRVNTKSGEQVSGLRLNEDTYSIQLLDDKSRLRSFLKSELTGIQIGKESTMPPYGSLLSQSELDDLIAYLVSLRRK
jgi:putative heme-binding domain-containing protein